MSRARIRYFEQEDVLHLVISEEPENSSLELAPNITVKLNDNPSEGRPAEGPEQQVSYPLNLPRLAR